MILICGNIIKNLPIVRLERAEFSPFRPWNIFFYFTVYVLFTQLRDAVFFVKPDDTYQKF